jgi:hypothetical protein
MRVILNNFPLNVKYLNECVGCSVIYLCQLKVEVHFMRFRGRNNE